MMCKCTVKVFGFIFTATSCLCCPLYFYQHYFSWCSCLFPSVFFLFFYLHPPPPFPQSHTPWVMFATQFGKCNSILIIINIYHVCEHVFLVLLICPVNKCLQQPGARGPLGLQGHHKHTRTHKNTPALSCRRLPAVSYSPGGLISVYTHSHMHFIGGWNGSGLLSTNDTSIHQPCCIDATHKHKNAHSLAPF